VDSPALRIAGLTKSFGDVVVLKDVSLTVERGHLHSLVGHNGSGKSTIVKCLSGYYLADARSRIWVGDRAVNLGHPAGAERAGARFIHQDLGLIPDLSAMDNICLAAGYSHGRTGAIDWRQTLTDTQQLVEDLGYDIDVRRPVRSLSLANKTGVAIARAVAPRPGAPADLIVLDEPTANLDSNDAGHLFEVLTRLRSRGLGALFITHHLDEVMDQCDMVTVLRDGVVVDTQPVSALAGPDQIVERMLGEPAPTHTHRAEEASSRPVIDLAARPALRVRHLTTGNVEDFSVDVACGEVVGIAGLAGSGRDEIALAVFGGQPRSGRVSASGRDIAGRPTSSVRAGMALVPARRHEQALIPTLDAAANLSAVRPPANAGFLDRPQERRTASEWTNRLGIVGPAIGGKMDQLSGGNQQKVILARWLRTTPTILVLDEPTQGVDVTSAATIHAEIRSTASSGCGVLVASSDTDELVALCDRVLVMQRGKVAAELTGTGITRDNIDRHILKGSR